MTNTLQTRHRITSIDALRGLVMVFMLADHVRETFLLHLQVSDPMDVAATSGPLFVSRLVAHLCAPVFVFLTGLSAFLYGARQADSAGATAAFLWKRGLFLVALELSIVNFAWTASFPPTVIYLQVIWAIGLSMLALAALVRLPRFALVTLGLLIVAGHNLLDPLQFAPGHPLHALWAVLHDRGWIEIGDLRLRTSYPVLPWIGIICLGYACGPWFGAAVTPARGRQRLLGWAAASLGGFVLLRWLNAYGDRPWTVGASSAETLMSFFNVTKYPPSLLFTALTLGIGLLLLVLLERRDGVVTRRLTVLGAAPMFFYVAHLYLLKLLFVAVAAVDPDAARFDGVAPVWMVTALLCVALYPAVGAFARLKSRRRDIAWLKYL